MRLWHYKLIPILDDKRLLGQHRECCALRGLSWGKKHSVVDYVFNYNYLKLTYYHKLVIIEMIKRKMKPDVLWLKDIYRGKKIGMVNFVLLPNINYAIIDMNYSEHDDQYLLECKKLLIQKEIKKENDFFNQLDKLEEDFS